MPSILIEIGEDWDLNKEIIEVTEEEVSNINYLYNSDDESKNEEALEIMANKMGLSDGWGYLIKTFEVYYHISELDNKPDL